MTAQDGRPLKEAVAHSLSPLFDAAEHDPSAREAWIAYASEYLVIMASACSPSMQRLQRARGVEIDPEAASNLRHLFAHLPAHLAIPRDAQTDDSAFTLWLHRNAQPWRTLEIVRVRAAGAEDDALVPSRHWTTLAYSHADRQGPALPEDVLVLDVRGEIRIRSDDIRPVTVTIYFSRRDAGEWRVIRVVPSGVEYDLTRLLVL